MTKVPDETKRLRGVRDVLVGQLALLDAIGEAQAAIELNSANIDAAPVGGIAGAHQPSLFGHHLDPAQRGRGRDGGCDAQAGHRDILSFMMRRIEVEQNVPHRIGEDLGAEQLFAASAMPDEVAHHMRPRFRTEGRGAGRQVRRFGRIRIIAPMLVRHHRQGARHVPFPIRKS